MSIQPAWIRDHPFGGKRLLQLGCGARPFEGAVNHDRVRHSPWVDVGHDLDVMPWAPLAPHGLFDVIVAFDLIEHITDVLGFVNECHRLLVPGGRLVMRGGAANNPASYTDPTHKHWFTDESMDFFDPDRNLGEHYGSFYVDTLGRPLAKWQILTVDRVNADPRWPATPDIQWEMVTR